MKIRIQAAVVALFAASVSHAQQAVQWKVSDGGNGHWYTATSAPGIAWADAAAAAVQRGGFLVTLTSPQENAFVVTSFNNASPRYPWIGLKQSPDAVEPAGGWTWVTDESFGWSNWSPSEPNGDPGFDADQANVWLVSEPGRPLGTWNDWHTGGPDGFVVEWSADCNNDGIVDYGQCRDGSLPDYDGNNIPDCCENSQPCVVGKYPVQWRAAEGGNGHWYRGVLESSFISWSQAKSVAIASGGSLACIGDAEEGQWIYARIASDVDLWTNNGPYGPYVVGPWIGGRGGSGNWRWDDGTAWTYSAWYPGEGPPSPDPTEQFAHFFNGVGVVVPANQWGDYFDVLVTPSFVVEWSADCNNDGIVDKGQILLGQLPDTNSNGIPDSCEQPPADCNGDGIFDAMQCRNGTLPDYNGNRIPDCCEAGQPCVVGSYPVQWRVSDGGNGHWYRIVLNADQVDWFACRDRAAAFGGHLATITSGEENQWVCSIALSVPGAYASNAIAAGPFLGGFQPLGSLEPSGGWAWVTGEPWGFSNWAGGQPDNYTGCGQSPGDVPGEHYLQFFYGAALWNDMSAAATCYGGSKPSMVIEWSADCNNDGVVDKGQILRGQLLDADDDGVPDVCQQPTCVDADIFRDFNVNGADLGILLSQWGPNTPLTRSDLNRDGVVDGLDLGIFLSFWGPCP
jgi:hypothetical protein